VKAIGKAVAMKPPQQDLENFDLVACLEQDLDRRVPRTNVIDLV
jgi:hypothetical protein